MEGDLLSSLLIRVSIPGTDEYGGPKAAPGFGGQLQQLVVPGIALGLLLAVAWVRLVEPSWYPLGGVEPLVYTFAAGTAFLVAVLAGIPSARRAAAVQPMVAMRAE